MSDIRQQLADSGIDYVTIEPDVCEYTGRALWYVKGHGIYQDSSVLAGCYRRVHLDTFDSLAAAQMAYPFGDTRDVPSPPLNDSPMPETAPEWFDPCDAGEAWGEEDY